jgi:hypothetical protein
LPEVTLSPVTGGELLALAMSLRTRDLRGLDVLRGGQDRAPPGVPGPNGRLSPLPQARSTDRWARLPLPRQECTMPVTIGSPAATAAAAKTRWDSFRVLLDDQRADCVRQRELALAEAATSVPDPVALSRAASLLLTIDEIDAALDRIADGTYGVCTNCGVDIPIERLEFRPFAAGCVACQASAR